MDYLSQLEQQSIYIMREAYARERNCALLWSMGKDSTSMVWIARKAFLGNIPFPVIHIDTARKFKEIYEFRDAYAKKWQLNLLISENETALREGIVSPEREKFACCNALKTEALKQTVARSGFKSLLLAIRHDEHGIRAKERFFSPRDDSFAWQYETQPAEVWDLYQAGSAAGQHMRVHPLLNWTELDVWRYVQRERIPLVPLYFSRQNKRYRSIGCECCCRPVVSRARTVGQIVRELEHTREAERSGRAQDKEDLYTMQKLRSLGYM